MIRAFLATGLTLFLLALLLPTVSYENWVALVIASLILTGINYLLKPVLKLLTLPLNLVTFGVFGLLLNVSLLWLMTYLVPGFAIHSMIVMGIPLNQFFSLLFISFLLNLIYRIIRLVI